MFVTICGNVHQVDANHIIAEATIKERTPVDSVTIIRAGTMVIRNVLPEADMAVVPVRVFQGLPFDVREFT